MTEPYLGEIRIFATAFAPKGWAFCDGQSLPISQNAPLYALVGTTFGGDGVTTFALPDLRGRLPIHWNNVFALGDRQGEETHVLDGNEMPAHAHTAIASSNIADSISPIECFWANGDVTAYAMSPDAAGIMATPPETYVGGGAAHENRSPYLPLTFCIALTGRCPM